jgi:DNA-binding transcriptional ArsR family regulator
VEREGNDGDLLVRCSKSRWVAEFPDFRIRLEVDDDRIWLRYLGETAKDEATKPNAIVEAILHLQANHGPESATKDTIAAYLETSPATAWRHLKTLVEAGLIRERRRDGGSSTGRGRKMNCFEVISGGLQ